MQQTITNTGGMQNLCTAEAALKSNEKELKDLRDKESYAKEVKELIQKYKTSAKEARIKAEGASRKFNYFLKELSKFYHFPKFPFLYQT